MVAVSVHWVPVDSRTAAHFSTRVSRLERERAARFRHHEDEWRSIVGAGASRAVVAQHLGVPAPEVAIERTCDSCGGPHGRPVVSGANLHVSLSHAGRWAVIAATATGPVGVDVEDLGSARGLPMPRDLILGPREQADDDDALMSLWVAKESYLKAIGTGLTVPLSTVSVRGNRVALPGRPSARLIRLSDRAGYRAAVCLLGRAAPRVTEIDLAVPQAD